MSVFNIGLETANRLYSIGWWGSLGGACLTAIAIFLLMWGTRVRDQDVETRMAQMNLSAAHALERAARLEKEAALLRLELASKTDALAKATTEARALATRDVFRPVSTGVRETVLTALRRLVAANTAPRIVRIHHYNTDTPGMNDLYAEIQELFAASGIHHEIGDVVGRKNIMVVGPSGSEPQPPITLHCAPGEERIARGVGEALSAVLKGEMAIKAIRKLPAGMVEVGILAQPQFRDDGTVSFR
jgi:hypothetical protein